VNYLFFNQKGQLRSGWRALFFVSLYVMSIVVLTALASAFAGDLRTSSGPTVLIRSWIMLVPAIGAGLLCGRIFEHLRPADFGISLEGAASYALSGLAVGLATLAAAIIPAVLLNAITFTYNSVDPISLLVSLGIFAIAAAWEEALFRGYVLQTLAREGYGWPAVVITAAMFGLGHADNPGSTAISTLNTVLAGIWFGVAYLRTRNLWFVWAIHVAWNWAQGSLLGIEVSGLTDIAGTAVLNEIDLGPQWISGGDYGIEASLTATVAILASTLAIRFIPPPKTISHSRDLDLKANVDRAGGVGDSPD
jgi:membrane protease YdiL (CAAX protease family)